MPSAFCFPDNEKGEQDSPKELDAVDAGSVQHWGEDNNVLSSNVIR